MTQRMYLFSILFTLIFSSLAVTPSQAANGKAMDALVGLDVPLFILKDLDQKRYKLRKELGKVILINFFFVGCAPCVKELPLLMKMKGSFSPEEFELVIINGVNDEPEKIRDFFKKIGIPGASALIDSLGTQVKRFKVDRYPSSFLVDRDGVIEAVYSGFPDGFEKELKQNITQLINEKGA